MRCKYPQRPDDCINSKGYYMCELPKGSNCIRDSFSPLTIEINEGLFMRVERLTDEIIFYFPAEWGSCQRIRITKDGYISGDFAGLSPKYTNEIIRVRAALGWTGKE